MPASSNAKYYTDLRYPNEALDKQREKGARVKHAEIRRFESICEENSFFSARVIN